MTTEAEAIADLAGRAAAAQIIRTEAGREYLVGPGLFKDVSEPYGVATVWPDHIAQQVTLQTVDSLVDYVNRFKTEDTVLFADIAQNKIVAAIDYHAAEKAALLAHDATLTLPYSVEWKLWTDANGRMMSQTDFARFIEENAADVATPTGADLLEIARDLQIARKADFRKVVRTASGVERFEYTESETATSSGGVEIPSRFMLSLPVYFDGQPVGLVAFLRHALDDGKVTLGWSLNRHENARQAVFKQIVLDAAQRTERPAVFGRL